MNTPDYRAVQLRQQVEQLQRELAERFARFKQETGLTVMAAELKPDTLMPPSLITAPGAEVLVVRVRVELR